MTRTARTICLLLLALAPAAELIAQEAPKAETSPAETSTTAEAAPETAAETSIEDSEEPSTNRHYQVRDQFSRLLEQHPHELWMILKLDPSLLTNDAFMAGYPEVQEFVTRHPEILKNPRFYLARFSSPAEYRNALDGLFEMLAVLGGVALTVVALGWLVRTLIEQKRWKQLSRTQSDVHNKILDRFGTSEQLLEYIHTPAGGKFLESAPIPLYVERPNGKASSPAARIVRSVQIGVVTAIVGLGMLVLSAVFEKEPAQGLFALGAIALCVGAGFIASAFVSLYLSRRLGLWEKSSAPPEAVDGTGPVR